MSYTLFGSYTSPFVRRIRLLLEDIPYEFKEVNIFDQKDSEALGKINPINQIPVLQDDDKTIWDSRMIFNYLNQIHKLHNMDWEDENQLTAIDGALSSGISLLLMNRSGLSLIEPVMIVKRNQDRLEAILDHLKPFISKASSEEWTFNHMSLYSFLDWASFRKIVSLKERPECVAFLETYALRESVMKTAIPKG